MNKKSYLDMLNELREAVETDIIPTDEKKEVMQTIQKLFEILWAYSA